MHGKREGRATVTRQDFEFAGSRTDIRDTHRYFFQNHQEAFPEGTEVTRRSRQCVDASVATIHTGELSLSPTMPATISVRQMIRTGSVGSLKISMPTMMLPTAPIPVHTA
jgi:hypothetical protein